MLEAARQAFQASPLVASATFVPIVTALTQFAGNPNDPLFLQQWSLSKINVAPAWALRSNGVPIAIVDSGVNYNHEDLIGHVEKGPNFGDSFDGSGDPLDLYYHGTVVSSIAAAATNNGIGMAGVAFSSSVIAIKVTYGNTGKTDPITTAKAFVYAVSVKLLVPVKNGAILAGVSRSQ